MFLGERAAACRLMGSRFPVGAEDALVESAVMRAATARRGWAAWTSESSPHARHAAALSRVPHGP